MSQPRDTTAENDDILSPIADIDELNSIFVQFQKPRANFGIGVEHERFVIEPQTMKPIQWQTPMGMHALMHELKSSCMAQDASTVGVSENEQLIAIMKKNASITLEPGGQLELSGAPLASIFDIDEELRQYESTLENALKKLQVSSLLMGFHPTALREDFDWVPKQRYRIMRAYMAKKGRRGHDMMLRTCTVQANFDYTNESDMVASFRLALLASPVVTALFASSPFREGKPSGFLSDRTMVWHETDPDRCGFPVEVFESGFSYRRWIDRALGTPMYFVRRAGVYHDATSITFREFMKNGFAGFKATHRDFADHLTTIFTDTRIKPQLEVRSADCGPKPFLRALPAFWKGLLYDEASRSAALNMLSWMAPIELANYQTEAARNGLMAKCEGRKIQMIAADLLELSRAGLKRQAKTREKDESLFLKPLFEIVESGKNIAQVMLERYKKANGSFEWLLDSL